MMVQKGDNKQSQQIVQLYAMNERLETIGKQKRRVTSPCHARELREHVKWRGEVIKSSLERMSMIGYEMEGLKIVRHKLSG